MSTSTTTISFVCPSSGCTNQHTAVVNNDAHDSAETLCKDCKNRVEAQTREGRVVKKEVI